MIYAIARVNDDAYYRDVHLDMALSECWEDIIRCAFTLDKEDMTVSEQWIRSPAAKAPFDEVALNDVPRWCRCMADKLRPRIVAEHFQVLIDEWQIRQAENQ